MSMRGIRGAIQVEADEPEAILSATKTLLLVIARSNPGLDPRDLASILFTVTPDLRSAYPAEAARRLGWSEVALMCAQEIPVPGGMPRVVRVLAHWNTDRPQSDIRAAYLGATASLRPDAARPSPAVPSPADPGRPA
jgi:chorismate mutase